MTKTLAIGKEATGFTLIELLVVLMIIGVAMSLMTLSIHVLRPSALPEEAEQLAATLNQAQDWQDLTGTPIGLSLTCHGWYFFDGDKHQPISKSELKGGVFTDALTTLTVSDNLIHCPADQLLTVVLSPDELQPSILLSSADQSLKIVSDGVGRFQVQP